MFTLINNKTNEEPTSLADAEEIANFRQVFRHCSDKEHVTFESSNSHGVFKI